MGNERRAMNETESNLGCSLTAHRSVLEASNDQSLNDSILLGCHGTGALRMRTGAAVVASAAFGGIGASLAAILFSG